MKTIAASSSPIITGTITTMGLVLIGSVLTSLLLHFSNVSEMNLPIFTYCINGLSLLIGGWMAGRKGGRKGWYFGGLTGIAYFALIMLIGFLAFDVNPQLNALIYLASAFILGALGGVFGVNMSSSTK